MRAAVLAAIKGLFEGAKKPVMSERKKKRMSAVEQLQVMLLRSPLVATMQQGQHLRRLTPHTFTPIPSFVHYIPSSGGPLGSLVWTDDARVLEATPVVTEVVSTLPLHTVSDVWGGKGYEGMAGLPWDDTACVTVVGKEGQALHLVCDSEDRRKVWIDGIREVFDTVKRLGKVKETAEEARVRGEEERRREEEAAVERDKRVAAKGVEHVPEGTDREMVVHMDDSTLSASITASGPPSPLPSIDAQGVDAHVDGGFTYEVDDVIAQAETSVSYSHHLPADGDDPPLSTPSAVANALNAGQVYSYDSPDDPNQPPPEPTHLRTLPSASPMHPSIIALVSGFTFTVYTLTTSAALHLHYTPDEGKLGALLYSTPPSSPPLTLPVSTLCDVFVGKQSAELRAPLASPADPACCFTIASKEAALHLCAQTEGERSLFLEGIKQLFLCQGKQVRGKKVKRERKAATATQPITARVLSNIRAQHVSPPAERTAPVVPLGPADVLSSPSPPPQVSAIDPLIAMQAAPAVPATRIPALPNPSQTATLRNLPVMMGGDGPRNPLSYLLAHSPLLATLRTGAVFTALFGSPPIPTLLLPLFVFYSPTSSRLGSIHWCDPATPFTYVDGQSLPLHRFSDVIQGKVTAEMRSTAAAPLSAALCFSLVTKTRVLNLVAKTERERKEWVEGVRGVFAFNKGGEEGKDVQPRTADVTRIAPLPFDTAVQLLSHGYLVVFLWEEGDEIHPIVHAEERLIWWEEDDEGDVWLCWNEKGARTRVDGQCMDVRAMTEVGVGKERSVFAGEDLQHHPPHCCVSMLCGEGQQIIHVIARREEAQFTFVAALRSFLLHFQSKALSPPALPALPLTPMGVTSPQALLSEGSAFISYSRTSPSPSLLTLTPAYTATVVFIHWDMSDSPSKYGQFFLSPLGQKLRTHPYTQFTEILNGKRSPELLSPAASAAPSECCLSLVGAKGALHLQAGSELQRNGWIEAIKCLYSQFSNKNAGGDVHASPFTSPTLCTTDSVLALKLPLLVQGVVVTSHMVVAKMGVARGVTIPPQRIVLSYDPTASVRGRLHWMNEEERGKGLRGQHPNTWIDLHEISGVKIGNDDWVRGKGGDERAQDDRGVSVWTEKRRLYLEFATGAEKRGWVHALHAVMCSGRKLNEMECETVVVRTTGVVHVVNTPYGLGEVTPCTPIPDILHFTLSWGRLYGPASPKIVRFIAVYTTQGLGYVVLPLTEPGWGGRRLVEVWMRAGGVGGGGGIMKVLAPVADLIVIPVMPPSMSDMIRQWFAGVRYPTPLQGVKGGHRGQKSLVDVGGDGTLSGSALFEEVNVRYRDEVRRASLDGATPSPHGSRAASPPPVPVAQGGEGGVGALPLLRLGHLMHLWTGVGADVARQSVLIFLDESKNRLYWHDVTAPKSYEEARTLPLDGVRVVKGSRGGTFPTPPVDDGTCFMLMVQMSVKLSLQAISGNARDEWIGELTRWLGSRAPSRAPPPSRPLPPPPMAAPAMPVPPSVAVFSGGDVFTSYTASGRTERVWVWYDEKSSRLGTIYWVEAEGERGKGDPDRRIPLVSLCDLTIGKGGDGWGGEDGKRADAWSCFTLKTKRVTLNLEAKSAAVRDAWIHHIKTTIANAGKKVIDAPQ